MPFAAILSDNEHNNDDKILLLHISNENTMSHYDLF